MVKYPPASIRFLTGKTTRHILLTLLFWTVLTLAKAQPVPPIGPTTPNAPSSPVGITISGADQLGRDQVSMGIQLLALLTILSLVPAILMMVTSFVRIAVVLGFVRRALGTPEVPPTQVVLGLALFLTFFVMAPTFSEINERGLKPYLAGQLTPQEAIDEGIQPLREFLFTHCRKTDLAMFVNLSGIDRPRTKADVPTHVLIPAFMISELKTAFIIGFILYIPFLIIDMVVSSILLSMGMMMMPPVMISLPFKVLLFVLVDGWNLVVDSLMRSY